MSKPEPVDNRVVRPGGASQHRGRRGSKSRKGGSPAAVPDDALLNYESILRQVADRDVRGWLLVAPGRRVLSINPGARAMLQYEAEVPASLDAIARDVNIAFAVGDAFHDRQPIYYESFLPDPDRLLRFQLIPVLAETEETSVVVITIDDITRLRHLETVRRDFVANVSHELRTPIASINLLVETLQNGAAGDPEAGPHFLRRIEVETQAMALLVEELLELSKLESGSLSLTPQAVDVRGLFESVLSRLAPAAKEKQLQVELDVQDSLPAVRADPERLEQVLMNLVHNAIKFTPADGLITIRASRQGRGLQMEVVDTGVGMQPGDAMRVFERFYKVDKGRSREAGSGLGLAIARHLLELHGSHLQVVSEPGRGSRFFFALPLDHPSPAYTGSTALR